MGTSSNYFMAKAIYGFIITIAILQLPEFATTSCPPGWKLYEKQCVGQIALLKTYDDARLYCQRSMNADLVVIDSQAKETFMETYVASTYSGASWIGLKDMTGDNNKNSHIWLPINKSVTDVGYSNWHPLEPNVLSHFCIILYMDGTPEWRDRNCYDKYYFICERPFISDATDKTKTDSMPINNYRRNLEDLKLSESASLVSLSSSIKHPPDKDVALQTEKLSMYEAPTVATSLAVPIMQTIESFANDFRQSTTIPTDFNLQASIISSKDFDKATSARLGNMQTVEDEIIHTSPSIAENHFSQQRIDSDNGSTLGYSLSTFSSSLPISEKAVMKPSYSINIQEQLQTPIANFSNILENSFPSTISAGNLRIIASMTQSEIEFEEQIIYNSVQSENFQMGSTVFSSEEINLTSEVWSKSIFQESEPSVQTSPLLFSSIANDMPKDSVILYELLPSLLSEISDEQLDIISQPQVSSRKFIITSWLEHSQIDIKESMLSMNDVIMNEVKIFTSPDISVSNQSLQDLAAESIHLQKDATISPELRTQEPMFSLKSSLDLTNQLDLSEVSLVSNIDSVAIFSEADGVDVITISSELTVHEPPMNFPKSSLNLADKPDLSVLEVSNIYSMTIFSEINKVEDHEDLSSITVDADARLILTEIIQLQNPTADLQSELGDIQKSSMDSAGDVCDQANNCPEYYATLPSQQEPDRSTINPLKSPIKNSISNLSSRTLYDTTLDMTYRTPTPSSITKYITQRKNTEPATSTFNGSQANQILASFNQNISKTTVNTAKVLGYSRTLHEIIDKIDMKSLSTAETTDLSEFVVKIVKKLVTAGINGSNQDKIASDYMQLLDHYFLRVAEKLSYGETFNFTDVETGDVTMVISVQQVEAYNSTNYEFVFNSKSALRKSDDVLINLSNIMFRKNETVKIIAGIYWFLQDTVARVNDQLTLSSDIISCKIEPYPVFQDNAIFQYHVSYPNKASKNSGNNWKCMYWDLQSRSWNNTGCTTNLNLNKVVCVCNHLTHFALLLQIKIRINTTLLNAINTITYGCLGTSVTCIIFTLLVYTIFKINSERFVIHKNLLVALMFSQICIITASQATKFEVLCKVMAIISHFFCLASFSWMLVEAAHLYFLIISVFNHRSKMTLYFIFGWGIPIIVVGVTVAVQHENYGRDQICWLSTKNGFTWAFIGPVVAIIAINFVVMIAVVKIAVASSTKNIFANHGIKNKLRGIKTMIKAISILCPILGLTWLIGLIPITQETIAVAYVFVILNSSQGISIFIFHCLYNSEVRQQYRRLIQMRVVCSSHVNKINSNVISSPKFSTSSNKIAKLKDDLNLSYKIIPLARAMTKPINEQEEGRLNCAY